MANILIVDDNKTTRFALKSYIEDEPYTVEVAASAEEAIDLLNHTNFDVVVTDLILPGKNGLELLKEIQRIAPATKTIIITGDPNIQTATQAIRASAFDYLIKPISEESFRHAVRKAVELKKLTEEKEALYEENLRYRKHLEKQVEQRTRSLQKSEQTFRLMFENNPMPMIIYDSESHAILAANYAASALYGYSQEELTRATIEILFDDHQQIPKASGHNDENLVVQTTKEVLTHTRDGRPVFVEILSHQLYYNERPACYIMINDISARKRTEKKLRESEKRYRMLFENMAQGVFYLNAEQKITSINDAALKLLNITRPKSKLDFSYFKTYRFYDENGKALAWEALPPLQALISKEPVLNRILHVKLDKQTAIWLIMDAVPYLKNGEVYEVFTTLSDITPLKRAENELRSSEQKLRAVINAIPDQLFLFSREGICLESKSIVRSRKKKDDFRGRSIFDIFPLHLAQRFQNMLLVANRTSEIHTFEYQMEDEGKLRDFEARLVSSSKGQILCLIRDITERKRYEVDLQKSESKFRILLESASQAIVLINMHGRITLVNSQMERLFGYSREELVGQPAEFLVPYSMRNKNQLLSQINFRHFLGNLPTGTHELTGMRKDGSEFPFEIRLSQVEMFEGPFFMALITDISERKQLESRLRRVEKLEAIGQLAGGIAHDFNNVLAGIIGLSELALRKIDEQHPARENIKLIINKSESAANLVSKLLMFSRQQKISKHLLNLNQVVLSNKKLLQRYLGEDIHLIIRLADDLHLIRADASAMDQIITNLCINARDAMPDGGELTIETHNVTLQGQEKDIPPGEYVQFVVADSGIGMSHDVQQHIFEPFFTTKELGQGTGLGLATVYGLVQQHDGYIQFDSQLGEGTTFRLFFPAVIQHEENGNTRYPGEKPVRGGHETILLVDDQIDILTTSKETLESYGYKVLIAGNGIQALEIVEKYHEIIDLVISDVVMPDMDGIELRMLCHQIKPSLKFLLMSAFSPKLDNESEYILKPFLGQQLARKVREILDRS